MAWNIVGGEEAEMDRLIIGAERGEQPVDYVIGAAAQVMPRLSPQAQLRLTPRVTNLLGRLRPVGGSGPQLQPVGAPRASDIREVVQGLDSGAAALIAAGAQATIPFNASMEFRPTRLMVGPQFAGLFTIDDIRVGADSLFLNAGPVPAEAFLPDAVTASALKRRTAKAGTPLAVLVTNIDGAAHRFRGALFGEALDEMSCVR